MSTFKIAIQEVVGSVAVKTSMNINVDEQPELTEDANLRSTLEQLLMKLCNEKLLGPAIVAAACCGYRHSSTESFDVLCGKLLCAEILVGRYGCLRDTSIDKSDLVSMIFDGLTHFNNNVRERARSLAALCLEKRELIEGDLKGILNEFGDELDEEEKILLEKEFELQRERDEINQREEFEKKEMQRFAEEAEKEEQTRILAKEIGERIEEELRWKTTKRGVDLMKFVGETIIALNQYEEEPKVEPVPELDPVKEAAEEELIEQILAVIIQQVLQSTPSNPVDKEEVIVELKETKEAKVNVNEIKKAEEVKESTNVGENEDVTSTE